MIEQERERERERGRPGGQAGCPHGLPKQESGWPPGEEVSGPGPIWRGWPIAHEFNFGLETNIVIPLPPPFIQAQNHLHSLLLPAWI